MHCSIAPTAWMSGIEISPHPSGDGLEAEGFVEGNGAFVEFPNVEPNLGCALVCCPVIRSGHQSFADAGAVMVNADDDLFHNGNSSRDKGRWTIAKRNSDESRNSVCRFRQEKNLRRIGKNVSEVGTRSGGLGRRREDVGNGSVVERIDFVPERAEAGMIANHRFADGDFRH